MIDEHFSREPPTYTIGTLVNDHKLYSALRASFEAGGFVGDIEWIAIDNTVGPQIDGYAGLNQILNRARGRYVVLCHQDLLLLRDDRAVLDARLQWLDEQHPNWAVAGNAGGAGVREIVRRITDKNGVDQAVGKFPHRVWSLDENFIVVRRDARVALSRDLSGFHMYGTDICLVADVLGYSCWVIDFHLRHLGNGAMGEAFARSERAFRDKWSTALRSRHLQTTCTYVTVSGRRRGKALTAVLESVDLKWGRLKRSIAKRTAGRSST